MKLFLILSLSGAFKLCKLVFWCTPRPATRFGHPLLVFSSILCRPAIMLHISVGSKCYPIHYTLVNIPLDDGAGTLRSMQIGYFSVFFNFLKAERWLASEIPNAMFNPINKSQCRCVFVLTIGLLGHFSLVPWGSIPWWGYFIGIPRPWPEVHRWCTRQR